MAVDDEALVGPAVRQEGIADPAEVGADLLGERHAGTDAGVDEEIVADRDVIEPGVEEGAVGGGDVRGDRVAELLERRVVVGDGVDAVAHQRLAAAVAVEELERGAVALGGAKQHLLVIALDERDARRGGGERHRALDDAARIRAAIDEVAEQDQRRRGGCARRVVRVDRGEQPVELVGAAVDVADRVDALAGGDRRRGRLLRSEEGFDQGNANRDREPRDIRKRAHRYNRSGCNDCLARWPPLWRRLTGRPGPGGRRRGVFGRMDR